MNMYRGRRRLLTLAIALLVVSPLDSPARAATGRVDEVNRAFQPAQVRISVNDRVVWTNRDSQSHSVTIENVKDLHPNCAPLLPLGCQGPGATVEWTFTSPGSYSYYCKLHQNADPPMRGTVTVGTVTTSTTSSTLTSKTSSTTVTTQRATSSTTATTRPLATSSTVTTLATTTSSSESTSVLMPGEPPPFDDEGTSAASKRDGPEGGSDSGTVALIVGLLLAVSAGGGYLLWRLRPSRA